MTDLHCHILPALDDGAKTPEEAVAILKKQQSAGVDHVALTSHFHPERCSLEEFLEKRSRSMSMLSEALQKAGYENKLTLKLGSEVFFSPRLCELDVEKLCIEGTDVMLLEFPTDHRPFYLKETLYHLQTEGITPLIAHVERYPYVMEDPGILCEWFAAGILSQMNSGAVLKSRRKGNLLQSLLAWNLVQVIASDVHSVEHRPANLADGYEALRKEISGDTVDRLIKNSDLIFAGDLPDDMDFHEPRKVLGRWR